MTIGSDKALQLMADMDPVLLEFVLHRLDSFLKWEVVRFFHANPGTVDTAPNIARYLGLDPAAVEAELNGLSELGILTRQPIGKLLVYTLAADPSMRARINQFAAAAQDPVFRAKAMYHIVRGMR